MGYSNGAGCYSTVTISTDVVVNAFTTTAITKPFTAWDWHIQVVWESSDLSLFSPASAPLLRTPSTSVSTMKSANAASLVPGADTSAQGTSIAGTTISTTTSTSTPTSQAGLSGGAIAGIVVGAILGIVALLGLVYFLLRKRRVQKRESVLPGYSTGQYTSDAKVAPDQQYASGVTAPQGQQDINELPATTVNQYRPELEAGVYGTTAELASKSPAAELDSGYCGPRMHSQAPASVKTPVEPTIAEKGSSSG